MGAGLGATGDGRQAAAGAPARRAPATVGLAAAEGVRSAIPHAPDVPVVAPRRLEFLDGIRAVAALFVVFHHSWLAAFRSFPRNTGPTAIAWLLYGHLAVAVFIVLSGFSLSLATVGAGDRLVGGARRFLRRRAWRILPAYWAALAFSVLVLATLIHARTGEVPSLKSTLVHGALLQDVIGSKSPNGAFWSIAPEWQIYFLFPLLLLCVRRWGALLATAGTTAVVVAGYLVATTVHVHLLAKYVDLSPAFLALFTFGMLAARVTKGWSRWHDLPWGTIAALASIAMVLVINLVGSVTIVDQFFWVDLGVGATVACIIVAVGLGRAPWLRAILESRPLVFFGSFSYSIYLIHAPVLEVVWLYWIGPRNLSPTTSFFLLVLVAVPIALVVSYAFYRVFERPFLRRRSFAALSPRLPRRTLEPEPAGGTAR